jgi:hypothetical protein
VDGPGGERIGEGTGWGAAMLELTGGMEVSLGGPYIAGRFGTKVRSEGVGYDSGETDWYDTCSVVGHGVSG